MGHEQSYGYSNKDCTSADSSSHFSSLKSDNELSPMSVTSDGIGDSGNGGANDHSHQGTSQPRRQEQCCSCAPICLPLTILIPLQRQTVSGTLTSELTRWVRSVSWGSVCCGHLQRLAEAVANIDTRLLDRAQLVTILEGSYSQNGFLQEERGCRNTISRKCEFPLMRGPRARL